MNIKKGFLVSIFLTFFSLLIFAQDGDQVKKIVIDAGHGGKMPGCVGKKSKEKDVTLAVALKFGKLITQHCPSVKVIYTRTDDATVEVYRRAEIANANKADLFISIHCNASENKAAHGVETFVMGLHKTEANIAIAKKENADILLEKNYKENYGGFNPNSPEASIIFSLYSTAYLKNSAILASKVQNNLLKNTKLADRKVQQAGFWVLYKVAMPSILVELGFLSNAVEEEYLIKKENQDIMAISLYNAFIEYKNYIEGKNLPLLDVKTGKPERQIQKPDSETITPTPVVQEVEKPQTESQDAQTVAKPNQATFRVQFMATPKNMDTQSREFRGLPNVKKYFENNLWKYTAGDEISWDEINTILKEVRKKYPDAFIIAFKNGVKIPVSEARQ